MEIFTHWQGVEHRKASAAIGNFDGVHLGHQALLEIARQQGPLGIVTFEPHPREFFAPDGDDFRLMNSEAKRNRLAKLGVEVLYELPFDAQLAALSPEAFAREVLTEGLGLSHAVVGADFNFGAKRAGDANTLHDLGAKLGFGVSVAGLVEAGGEEISSTKIRNALSDGRPRDAAEMLGHWHRIEGEVLHGEKRGRDLGFPTANMSIVGLHQPRHGIYAVLVDVLSGPSKGSYHGAASLGVRPTFGVNQPNLESYLFDFDGDLYGAHLSVALVDHLRDEVAFDDLEALKHQMTEDCRQARDILANG